MLTTAADEKGHSSFDIAVSAATLWPPACEVSGDRRGPRHARPDFSKMILTQNGKPHFASARRGAMCMPIQATGRAAEETT